VAARHAARRQAIDLLYQADVTGQEPAEAIAAWRAAGEEIDPFAEELVVGVTAHAGAIDVLLDTAAVDWSVDRMPAVDRTILRVAILELRFRDDVPAAVAIDEAVGAAKELSTEDSARFVNGVLGRIAREAEPA
jgi:N utilization substance protein B